MIKLDLEATDAVFCTEKILKRQATPPKLLYLNTGNQDAKPEI